jgi:heme-degrading monooxygenase HmoA
MYARVTNVNVDPNRFDEAIDIYENNVVAALQGQPGFVSTVFLGDRATGKSMTVTIWETEADEQETVQSGFFQEQVGKFGTIITTIPQRQALEVLVQA